MTARKRLDPYDLLIELELMRLVNRYVADGRAVGAVGWLVGGRVTQARRAEASDEPPSSA